MVEEEADSYEDDSYEEFSSEEEEEAADPEEEYAGAYSEYEEQSDSAYDDAHYRIDEPEPDYSNAFPDPDALKGLSKRERRRLRKQWREQQRQMGN